MAATVERMVRGRAAAQGWDPDEVLIPLGIVVPTPRPAPVTVVKPPPAPKPRVERDPAAKTANGIIYPAPARCAGGCGVWVAFCEVDIDLPHTTRNGGRGRCPSCAKKDYRARKAAAGQVAS